MTRFIVALIALTSFFGLCLQSSWDDDCTVQQPGTHWNADDWSCK